MLSEKAHETIDEPTDRASVESAWRRIKQRLENESLRVSEEIKTYPHPIPACDAQFNYLLEERARLAEELYRLESFSEQSLTESDAMRWVDEFIRLSGYITAETEPGIGAA